VITIETLTVSGASLNRVEVEHWIEQGWVRADPGLGTWLFHEIDVARLRLVRELRFDLGVQEDALPIVLRLLDQLYDERRRLRRVRSIIENVAAAEVRAALLDAIEHAHKPSAGGQGSLLSGLASSDTAP
jgi:chaperone modulatory protein CbpM